jgi:hypothetical protein
MCIVLQNPHVIGDDQQGGHREGVPQPAGNGVMQGEMQYPRIDAHNYNAAHYPPPSLPVSDNHRSDFECSFSP